ncbi:hypothetical protein HK405_007633 [Cladochytrium tenue]|nr:hypothetical protein HK405_007633 [Cladochytrium tenue]
MFPSPADHYAAQAAMLQAAAAAAAAGMSTPQAPGVTPSTSSGPAVTGTNASADRTAHVTDYCVGEQLWSHDACRSSTKTK